MKRTKPALELATDALARRDLAGAALTAKLAAKGVHPAEAAAAVARLEAAGYVDDGRFAHGRAAQLAERGWGDEGIRHDLERQGCGGAAIEAALAALDPETERARLLVARLGAGPRTARRLAAKGFSADALEAAVAR